MYDAVLFLYPYFFFSGETVSKATQFAMEQNDTINSFGLTIDLLLKIEDSALKLCSNERKNSKNKHLKLKLQSETSILTVPY